jgi:uracil-DNA glycosylase family 4
MPQPLLTAYQRHKLRWKNCTRCSLCETRQNVVLLRGTIPAEVLFIGESPGNSEDVLGKPFVGPAGKLLDHIIEKALKGEHTYCLTNLVACIPLEVEGGKKVAEPTRESILACAPRLVELVKIVKPRYIIGVGSLAKKWIGAIIGESDWLFDSITHPSAILRANVAQQGLAIETCIVTIESLLETPF